MQQTFNPLTPKIALVVVAHPDDIEVCFGGTIATWTDTGTTVHYLILTDGSNGTDDPSIADSELIKTRQSEQQAAAAILGVNQITFRNYVDGQLTNTPDVQRDIVRLIRQIQPDVVLTFDPSMLYSADHNTINHPDHRAAGQATLDAVFPYARNLGSFPELLAENLQPFAVPTILLSNLARQNFFVDITQTFERKLDAFAAHTSQVADFVAMKPRLHNMATETGAQAGYKYAEGFIRIDTIII